MKGLGERLTDWLSRALEPDERDAVRGDLAESGATGGEALSEIAGLVLRRQAALWADWRPWLALAGVLIPVGYLLSRMAIDLVHGMVFQLMVRWSTGERYLSGLSASEEVIVAGALLASLLVGAWLSGFVLGSLARQTAWVHGLLFLIGWSLFWAGPRVIRAIAGPWPPTPDYLWASLALVLAAPLAVIAAPSVIGVRQGSRRLSMTARQAGLASALLVALTALRLWSGTWHAEAVRAWSKGAYDPGGVDWAGVAARTAIVTWPMMYLLVTAKRRGEPAR